MICIIPARKGSKRIPGKNKKLFLGIPIIEYVINTCYKSNLFDKIIIASDDKEIINIKNKYPFIEIFERSEKNASDNSSLSDIVQEVLSNIDEKLKRNKYGCCVLPTGVFTTQADLTKGLKKIKSTNADSVAAFIKYRYPPQRGSNLLTDLKVKMLNPEYRWTRTQDLEAVYHDAGQFYWFDLKNGLKGENKYGVLLENQFAIDIDEPEDWILAEHLYKFLKK